MNCPDRRTWPSVPWVTVIALASVGCLEMGDWPGPDAAADPVAQPEARIVPLGDGQFALEGLHVPDPIPIETAPVTGTVTYQGQPLEDYRVYFYASDHPAQEPATARIDHAGRFSLSVREPDDGAILGINEVWFAYDPELPMQTPGLETPFELPPPKVRLPEKYLDRERASLTIEVTAQGINDLALNLQ